MFSPILGPAMLAAEVLGQLRIQRGLENVLRELAEQAARPRQAHTLLLRLREQALCDFPLIDDLPGHGINHHVNNDTGRDSHDHLLSDQARPSHTTIQTAPKLMPQVLLQTTFSGSS